MAYKLIVSSAFDKQLDEIISYVAVQLNNTSDASAILDDVEAVYHYLQKVPESLALCSDPFLASKGYRKAILKHHDYVNLYRVVDYTVRISGIFHMKENYYIKL